MYLRQPVPVHLHQLQLPQARVHLRGRGYPQELLQSVPLELLEDGLEIAVEYNLRQPQRQAPRVLLFPGRDGNFLLQYDQEGEGLAHEFQKMGHALWLFPRNNEFHQLNQRRKLQQYLRSVHQQDIVHPLHERGATNRH